MPLEPAADYPTAVEPPAGPGPRHFPPPWTAARTGGWRVDASGHVLTVDEARRIALGIARLPHLLTPTK